MKNGFNARRLGVVTMAALGALMAIGAAQAKEGASQIGKTRPKPVPVLAPCVEKGGFTAWGGLYLSPWKITTPGGQLWTMSFDEGGTATYDLNDGKGSLTGVFLQPFTVLDNKRQQIFTINVVGGNVLPLSDCTMIVTTDIGPLYMQRS